ncbi:alpha/beta fold hydrolase [Bordetella tumulicola]|uniref:alpha/beta fold hydrolase n=1 Tax=Bordetella tumulicola TaxID=1649133 RepID=UPI0039F02343
MTTLALHSHTLAIDGLAARILRDREAHTATVFVHGGAPGLTPYSSGAHIWGAALGRFAEDSAVLALDLPGFGGSDALDAPYTIDAMADHIDAVVRATGMRRCHLVAHDTGGLAALLLACRQPGYIEAVSVVSSVAAAPTGDGVENTALAYPPQPLGSRTSQRWALERLSYSPHHVRGMLDDCVQAAQQAPHQVAAERMADPITRQAWNTSVARAKARLFEFCRGPGVPVPVQVVWGTHDPTGTIDQGLWLYRILAQHQPIAHFHLINRAGALPFREQPEVFHGIISAFSDAVR